MERTSVIDLCLACSIALGVLSGHESDPHAPHPSEILYQVGGTGKPAIVSFASNPRVQATGGRIRVTDERACRIAVAATGPVVWPSALARACHAVPRP